MFVYSAGRLVGVPASVDMVVTLGAFVLAILDSLLRVASFKEGHGPIRLV